MQACAPRGLSCTSSTSKRLRSFASRLSRAWHRGPHLAGVLAKQQRFEESFECYARAAELYGEVEVSPAGILWLAGVRASMGLVQERMGAMEPALLQYQQALVLYEKHLGSWHARVGGVLVAMAGGCQRLGRRSEALRLYLRALAVFSRALGPEHLVLADVYNHIGSLFAQASHRSSYLKAINWYYAALLLLMRWNDEHVDHRPVPVLGSRVQAADPVECRHHQQLAPALRGHPLDQVAPPVLSSREEAVHPVVRHHLQLAALVGQGGGAGCCATRWAGASMCKRGVEGGQGGVEGGQGGGAGCCATAWVGA